MVNNLKSLIIQQIKRVFGNVKVYDEPVKQGLVTPAFLVLIFNSLQERKLAKQVSRTISINVSYFPKTKDIRSECDDVFQTFQDEFRYISKKYHIHSLEGTVEDDVLIITFNVNVLLQELVEETKMQTLGGVNIDNKD
ncbi:phage tail terminator family protein [Cytobacillus praedii]|uniref:DUF2294 family protein n=1 Tax=Cytobacillus praedii TaxID=1742358 RepID=A0A4R1AWL7_9BACI|nr:hypothetical protein [Cytobacillus praedii]TCJ01495.1 hypothetical protein E0Y62_23760 [Cytobacillus praedii]